VEASPTTPGTHGFPLPPADLEILGFRQQIDAER
jgi:hypothetical protein